MCDISIEMCYEKEHLSDEMFDLINIRNACTVFALRSFEDFRNIHKKWHQFYDKRTRNKSLHVDIFKESNTITIA